MKTSFFQNALRALAIGGTMYMAAMAANAAVTENAAPLQSVSITKTLAPECRTLSSNPMASLSVNKDIAHRYMLLMIFKKGSGSQYFGNARFTENGCISDVAPSSAQTPRGHELALTGQQLYVMSCPNDCERPFSTASTTTSPQRNYNNGNDPLGSGEWGILSLHDQIKVDEASDAGDIEIWEIAVNDACHARNVFNYHSAPGTDRVLARAKANGDLQGQVLVGFPGHGHASGPSQACR